MSSILLGSHECQKYLSAIKMYLTATAKWRKLATAEQGTRQPALFDS